MPLAGAGYGAAQALHEVMAQQMLEQQAKRQAQEAAARISLEQQQMQEALRRTQVQEARQAQADALARDEFNAKQSEKATDRNIGMDAANVLAMPGMSKESQANELLQSALRNPKASSTATMLKTVEGLMKKPEMDPVEEYRKKKQIDAEYRQPEKPEKRGVHVVGGNLVDDTGKVLFTDPNKAKDNAPTPYSQERAGRTIQSVDELMKKVSGRTAGMGSLLANIPATDARNFRAELDTLKANIAFNELAAMREASKTGGALGQVSDREGQLLQSALGALDAGQSPDNLRSQLQKIKDSVQRWQAAGGQSQSLAPMPSHGGDDPASAAQALIDKARAARKGKP